MPKTTNTLRILLVNLGTPLSDELKDFLAKEHPTLTVLVGDRDEWSEVLNAREELAKEFNGHEYYILHRYGALVMAFNQQHTGNELLTDLNFLIKTSN